MGIPVVDKQKQNRENYHVKCSTDYKEPTEDATEGRDGTDLQQGNGWCLLSNCSV